MGWDWSVETLRLVKENFYFEKFAVGKIHVAHQTFLAELLQ